MNILFTVSGLIGSAVISTGILGYLLDTYPEARFTLVVAPVHASLFEAMPRLERLIIIHKLPCHLHWIKIWKETRGIHWDWVIDLRSGILGLFLQTTHWKPFRRALHRSTKSRAEQYAALLGISTPPPTRLWVSEAIRRQANTLLPDTPYIVMAPCSSCKDKDWPIERFVKLAQRLCSKDRCLVVIASAQQKEWVQPLVRALPEGQVIDLSGRTDLLTAYAVLERAQLFIGNDSGPLHMAAAAKIPCVGIFGTTNDKIFAPHGSHVAIVTARVFCIEEGPTYSSNLMSIIDVDKVEAAAKKICAACSL